MGLWGKSISFSFYYRWDRICWQRVQIDARGWKGGGEIVFVSEAEMMHVVFDPPVWNFFELISVPVGMMNGVAGKCQDNEFSKGGLWQQTKSYHWSHCMCCSTKTAACGKLTCMWIADPLIVQNSQRPCNLLAPFSWQLYDPNQMRLDEFSSSRQITPANKQGALADVLEPQKKFRFVWIWIGMLLVLQRVAISQACLWSWGV